MMPAKEMAGQHIGRATVLCRAPSAHDRARWKCLCDCGREFEAAGHHLRRGYVQSCGCARNGNPTHGMRDTPTYRSWQAMRQRCRGGGNPKDRHLYTGVSCAPAWDDFAVFLTDMGERPLGKTLDRYPDNGGNYEPGNCRWATPKEQANNRRSTTTKKATQ